MRIGSAAIVKRFKSLPRNSLDDQYPTLKFCIEVPRGKPNMGDDSAELVIDGQSRRVAMDITKVDPEFGGAKSQPPGKPTEIEGEVHDQEDLNGREALLKIDRTGGFKIRFHT